MSLKAPPSNPLYRRGDVVRVVERGLRPWRGMVMAVKWSAVSGWAYEVEQNGEGVRYVVSQGRLRREATA